MMNEVHEMVLAYMVSNWEWLGREIVFVRRMQCL
jgi:hypothetical protein